MTVIEAIDEKQKSLAEFDFAKLATYEFVNKLNIMENDLEK